MASDWNRLLERLLAEKLTVAEHRLALALARQLLGWKRTEAPLGQALLRNVAGLDGRSFERALAGLIEKRLVNVTGGGPGRGKRATYTLMLDPQTPALQRAITDTETPAPQRANRKHGKTRSHGKKNPLYSGHALIEAGVKDSAATAAASDLIRKAFETFTGHGGSIQLERERGALARNVRACVKDGIGERSILAACAELGRRREFPGLLKQRAQAIAADGGPCQWEAIGRARLTPAQLRECGCARCATWADSATQYAEATS
jgi:hypothetical protein